MSKRNVKPEHIRREQIIQASFDVINEVGLSNTTIARITQKAELSVGIVSHYFGDKQGLINACMLRMLSMLWQTMADYRTKLASTTPQKMIHAIIDANFDSSQISPRAMRVWLEFWSASLHMAELKRLRYIHERRLFSNLLHYFMMILPKSKAQNAAQGMSALIGGLWLRGSLNYDTAFDHVSARTLAYQYLEMQLHYA